MAPKDDSDDDEEEREQKASLRYRGTRKRDVDFLLKSEQRDSIVQLQSGLQYKVRHSGPPNGRRPKASMPCRIHFRGILTDGTEFDTTYGPGRGSILMRPDQAVPGWCEALQLMREGDRWEIIVPSHLGYGTTGAGPIPAGAVLIYECELLEVDAKELKHQPLTKQAGMIPLIGAIIALGMFLLFYLHFSRPAPSPRGPTLLPEDAYSKRNPYVYFDIEVGGKPAGRIEFELFARVTPKAAENFRALSTGEKGVSKDSGKPLHFKGSIFHRVIPGFMCQAGDFTNGNGRGGESIFGRTFPDEWERGVIHHTKAGLLSMANRGPNTQSSQFFITVAETHWLDNKHVVFGRVSRGMEVVHHIETLGSRSGEPSETVVIADCGALTGRFGDPVEAPDG